MQSPTGNDSSAGQLTFDNWTYIPNNSTLVDVATEQVATLLNVYYTPLLVTLGTIGNLLSVYVFYKSKLWLQSTSQYLSALAVSDTIFLIHLLPPWLSAVHLSKLFHREGFCQSIVFTSYVSCCLSAWLVVAFTVERFVAVLHPLKRTAMCTVKRARFVIVALTIAALLINVPILRFVVPSKNDCNVSAEYITPASQFNVADTLFSFTIPLALIIVLNTCIGIGVWTLGQTRDGSHRAQQRVTRMLLIVSTVFVVFNLPAYTMRVLAYTYDMSDREYTGLWAAVQQITLLVFNTNFGINFVLYCMTGQNFRRALMQTLFYTKRKTYDITLRQMGTSQPRTSSVSTSAFTSITDDSTGQCTLYRTVRQPRLNDGVRARWVFRKECDQQQPSNLPINHRTKAKLTSNAPLTGAERRLPHNNLQLPLRPQPLRRIPYNLFPLRYIITSRTQTYNAEVAAALFN